MNVTTIGSELHPVTADLRPPPSSTPIVAWEASSTSIDAPIRRGTRWLGATVGVAVALVPAVLALAIAGSPFLALGIPAAAIAGGMLGSTVRAPGGIAGATIAMAVLTVGVADGLLMLGILVQAILTQTSIATVDPATAIFGLIYIGLIGLVIVGVPMLVITVPCGLVWAFLVRRIVSHHIR